MPKHPRLLLDTSVLISALNSPTGASAQLVDLARHRRVDVLVTAYILFETEEVVKRKFPKLTTALVTLRAENILTIVADPKPEFVKKALPLLDDPKDVPILAGALAHRVSYLVTLDRRDFVENRRLAKKGIMPAVLPSDALKLVRT